MSPPGQAPGRPFRFTVPDLERAAELYDRARPRYLPEPSDDLSELAGTGPGCRGP